MAELWKTNGEVIEITPANGEYFTRKELCTLLNADNIVFAVHERCGVAIVMDENDKHEVNKKATIEFGLLTTGCVHGDVVYSDIKPLLKLD